MNEFKELTTNKGTRVTINIEYIRTIEEVTDANLCRIYVVGMDEPYGFSMTYEDILSELRIAGYHHGLCI